MANLARLFSENQMANEALGIVFHPNGHLGGGGTPRCLSRRAHGLGPGLWRGQSNAALSGGLPSGLLTWTPSRPLVGGWRKVGTMVSGQGVPSDW